MAPLVDIFPIGDDEQMHLNYNHGTKSLDDPLLVEQLTILHSQVLEERQTCEQETDDSYVAVIDQARLCDPFDKDNLGFRILLRHGWTEGLGLGRMLQGCVNPVPVEYKYEQLGLGRLKMEVEKIEALGKHRRLLECEKPYREEEPPSPILCKENLQGDGPDQQQKGVFQCSLCRKVYKCYHQWDNHLHSYEHAHKQRLNDLTRKEMRRKLGRNKCKHQHKKAAHVINRSPSRVPLKSKSINMVHDEGNISLQQGLPNKVKFCLKKGSQRGDVHRLFQQHIDVNGPLLPSRLPTHCLHQSMHAPCVYYQAKPVWGSSRCCVPFVTFVRGTDDTPSDNGIGDGASSNTKQSEDPEENPNNDDGTDNEGGDEEEKDNGQNSGRDNDGDGDKDKPPNDNQDQKETKDEEEAKEEEKPPAEKETEDGKQEDMVDHTEKKEQTTVACDPKSDMEVPLDEIALPPPINLEDIKIPEGKSKLLTFVKVISQDEVTELEWPAEMIQYTTTEPKLTYSCNPLYFDLTALCGRPSRPLIELEVECDNNKPLAEDLKTSCSTVDIAQSTDSAIAVKIETVQSEDMIEKPKTKESEVDEVPLEIKPKKKTKHNRKHKKKKKSQKAETEKKEKKNKRKKKRKKKAKENAVNPEKETEKDLAVAPEADDDMEKKTKEKPKKKSKHKKKKRKHKKSKKRKHEGEDDIKAEKKLKCDNKDIKEEVSEESELKITPPELESESLNADDMKGLFKMKFKSTVKSGLIKPEVLQEEDASVDQEKPVSKMTSLATRIEENEKIKEKEISSQRSTGSRKRTISENSQNAGKRPKKAKKAGKKKKMKAAAKSETASAIPVDKDFNGDDGTNVPKWDTSDSELENGTATGFGKITQLDMQQAVNQNSKADVNKSTADCIAKPITSDRQPSRSSHRSRSYSRSRWGRSHSSVSDEYSRHSSYSSYSRSRSRSYSRSYTRSRSYSSYSGYSSRSRSYSYSSRSCSYRSRSYSRSRRRHRSYSRDSYSSSSYSRSRSRSYSMSRSRSRSRSRDLLKESPDKEYSSLLPKRDPKPVRKSEKDREQRKFDPNDLMVTVPINSEEVSGTAQDLLKKVKEKENDADAKSPSLTTKVQNSNGKAVVPLIDKMPSARRKDDGAELIPLPLGKQPGKGPHFIGPTLPPDHPLAHLQDIPVPPKKSRNPKPDLSKVPLPPPITMANAKNMKFLSRVPPPPPPPVILDKDGTNGKVSPNKESEDTTEGDKNKKSEELLPEVVIPPEQAQMYIALQKQARKHARKQKREDGEDVESTSESEPEESEPEASIQDENDTLVLGETVPVATPVTPLPQVMLTPTPVIPGATFQQVPVPMSQPHLVPVAISGGGVVMMAQNPIQTIPQATPTLVQVPGVGTTMMAMPHPSTSAAYAQALQLQQAQAIQASQIAAHNQILQQQLAMGGAHPTWLTAGQAIPSAVLAASPHALQLAAPAGAHMLAGHQPGTVMLGPPLLVPRVRHHPSL